MGLLSPILFSVLTLITISVASDVDDLTSNSIASFSQFQTAPNSITADNTNDVTSNNDSEENFVLSLIRHAFQTKGSGYKKGTHARTGSTHARTGSTHAKTGSGHAKRPSKAASYNKKPAGKTRSSGGVSASTSSPGTLVIASSSNGKRCVTIKRPCGTTCSPDSKSIGMCSGGWKPKYCVKGKKMLVACPGKRVKMCKSTEKVSDMCEKKVKQKVRCPDTVGKRTVCSYPKVAVHSCKKLPSRCSKMRKKKCRYRKTSKKLPCRKPKRPCRECFNKTAFKKCKTTITRKVEVPCGSSNSTPSPYPSPAGTNTRSGSNSTSESPLPTPSSSTSASPFPEIEFFDDEGGYDFSFDDSFDGFDSFDNVDSDFAHQEEDSSFGDSSAVPISFGGAQEHTKSVQCFASLFNEEDCKRAPDFCQLFDNAFDSDKCTREVCRECGVIKDMQVGQELRDYCRDLRASCHFFSRMLVTRMMETAAVARSSVEKSVKTKKCYRNETKTIVLPCNYRLPKSEVCKRGCRVGICEKIEKKRVSKYCRGHLPKSCYQKCSRKLVKRKVCHTLLEKKRSTKVCEKDTKVKYKCYKNKTVKKPCKGEDGKLCSKLQKIKYVCGKLASKFGKCTGAKGEKKCTTKMCVHKKCS